MRAERWVFDRFELLPSRGELRRQGEPVAIAAKPLAVLCELIRHRDRTVTKQELLATVWPGLSVSEAAFTSVIRDLRRVLGESGAAPRFVATLRGRGIRFVHPVLALPASEPLGEDDPERLATGDAWSAAAAHFEAALRALDRVHASRGAVSESPLVVRERGDLLVALARARWAGGSTEAARAAFLDAADAARRFGDAETLARASLGFAGRTDVTPHVSRESVLLLEEALGRLGSANPPLRAELLARLGTELQREGDGSRADALTREAVAEAERAGDPSTLAYVLTARHFVLQRSDVSPRQRIAVTDRVFAIAGEGPPSDVLALALQERLLDLLELGEGSGFPRPDSERPPTEAA